MRNIILLAANTVKVTFRKIKLYSVFCITCPGLVLSMGMHSDIGTRLLTIGIINMDGGVISMI